MESHDELVARSPLLNLMTRQGLSRLNYEERAIPLDTIIFELGESAGIAAAEAIRQGIAVQDLPNDELRPLLDKAGQRLQFQR